MEFIYMCIAGGGGGVCIGGGGVCVCGWGWGGVVVVLLSKTFFYVRFGQNKNRLLETITCDHS